MKLEVSPKGINSPDFFKPDFYNPNSGCQTARDQESEFVKEELKVTKILSGGP